MQTQPQINLERRAMVVYAALLLLSFVWLGLIFAPAWLVAEGHELLAMILSRGFSAICHQLPGRSFHLHGFPLAVCSRCTGIYAGFAFGLMLYPFVRSLGEEQMPSRRWLILAGLPLLLDFGGGFLGLFNNTFLSRAGTGALAGGVAAFYILPGFISTFRNFSMEILYMAQVDYKKPALIGGAIVGLLSVMPILQTLSICFCLWAWVGGAVAAKILISNSPQPITPREGARVGLFAGLFGALIYFVIETPLAAWQMQAMMDTASKMVKEPQAVELYQKIGQNASLRIIFALLFTVIGSLFTIGFTVLGGMVGVKLFEKRQNQAPPPPYDSSNYPPPPRGDQGNWPQS